MIAYEFQWKKSQQHCNRVLHHADDATGDVGVGSFHTKSTKKSGPTQILRKLGGHRETTPDQILAYFDYPPLRHDRSIFEAIIYIQTAITLYVFSIEPCNLIY